MSITPAELSEHLASEDLEDLAYALVRGTADFDVVLAAGTLLTHSYRDLLSGYWRLRERHLDDYVPDVLDWARRLLVDAAENRFSVQAVFEGFATVAALYPNDAAALVTELLRPVTTWDQDLSYTPYPGLLTRDLLRRSGVLDYQSHGDYLRGQVRRHVDLTDAQRALAFTLCEDWAGTLESLVTTALAMEPAIAR